MDTFKTSDLGVAAILMLFGFQFDSIADDGATARRKFFIFSNYNADNKKSAEEISDDYFQKKLAVEPMGFYSAQKQLKACLYDHQNKHTTSA